jgi:hypothetical protein
MPRCLIEKAYNSQSFIGRLCQTGCNGYLERGSTNHLDGGNRKSHPRSLAAE